MQRTCQARACASQSRGCTHVGAGARQDIARARGGGGEHTSGGSRPSTLPPTKQHKRHAHAGAAGATGQPARGRHAPRCAAADARSVGRVSGLAALPWPSQCRPEKGPVKNFKIGTRWAARRRGPAHAHGAVHMDAGQPRAMRSSSAPPGACSARSRAPHPLSYRHDSLFQRQPIFRPKKKY